MKLMLKEISEKDGEGRVVLLPEEPEDMWHIFNLLAKGDLLRATTFRKVVTESSTGSTKAQRKRVTLTVAVEDIDFDPQEGPDPAARHRTVTLPLARARPADHVRRGAWAHTQAGSVRRGAIRRTRHW